MEINLILTAQTWQLGRTLECGQRYGGVMVVKNLAAHTYLTVGPKQWDVLQQFREPKTVPAVLEYTIAERMCPALGEYYELVLKAVRAGVLVPAAGAGTGAATPPLNWPVALKPASWAKTSWILLGLGLGLIAFFPPTLPSTVWNAAVGLAWLLGAVVVGAAFSASLLSGVGGEVYTRRRWLLSNVDVCMFSPADQRTIELGAVVPLAAITGILAWWRPEWSFLPLVGLLVRLRPIFGGRVSRVVCVGAEQRLTDAEHNFIFPPNATARSRLKLLRRGLRLPSTWLEIIYAAVWTIALAAFASAMTEVTPWRLAFWQTHGLRLGAAFVGSLLLLGLIYAGLESYVFTRDRALARHETLRQAWQRWFGRSKVATDDAARLRAILRSPLLRQLTPPAQQALVGAFQPAAVGVWKNLHNFDEPVGHVSLILSGKVGVYRRHPSGRRTLIQVLVENDIVGLHAMGDPERPQFLYRTLTPVVLLRAEAAVVQDLIAPKFTPLIIANHVQKLPFLARLGLCQNWHLQSIQRFAELTRVANFAEGEVILRQGSYSDSFYIVFEGMARIMIKGRQVGVIEAGNFFGEIGLLQNSSATAQVVAGAATRCLAIPRNDFLRFVTHNYSVALRLERVSSQRLGRPIFPLTPGNFRQL